MGARHSQMPAIFSPTRSAGPSVIQTCSRPNRLGTKCSNKHLPRVGNAQCFSDTPQLKLGLDTPPHKN